MSKQFISGELTGSTYVEPLPFVYTPDRASRAHEVYETAIKDMLGLDDQYLPAHLNVAHANVSNRLKHIAKNTADFSQNSMAQLDFIRLSHAAPSDYQKRMHRFALGGALPSLELATTLRAGEAPSKISTDLAEHALFSLSEGADTDIAGYSPRIRAKFQRPLEVDGNQAIVVTAKTDGMSLDHRGNIVDVKARESGFVLLNDERLDDSERQSLRILGNLSWGEAVTEDMVKHHRHNLHHALREKALFHPTVSVVFLARHIKRTRG